MIAGLIYQLFVPEQFAVHCLFKRLFSIPCPTCGMTRAFQRLLALDLPGAFLMQPLVLIVPLFLLLSLFISKHKGRVLFGSACVILTVNWIYLLTMN